MEAVVRFTAIPMDSLPRNFRKGLRGARNQYETSRQAREYRQLLEVRRDIEAAAYTARALGYRTLVLHGHSLGNIQVQFYAANNWEKDIKAVVLTGAFGNLPWKSRNLLVQNEQNLERAARRGDKSLREGKDAEVMPVQMNWITGQRVPITGRHFLTYRSENTSAATAPIGSGACRTRS